MERYIMFINWKTQNCQDVNSSQIDVQIEHNPKENLTSLSWKKFTG